MATGTQTRVHGKARVKPTFVAETGKYTAKTMTDIKWGPDVSTEPVRGAGSILVVAHAVSESSPKVSFQLEHDDLRAVRALLRPGDLCSITFTATQAPLDPFDVAIEGCTVIYGEGTLDAATMYSLEWPCIDIKIDGLSIVEDQG
jgi:hypothetical protein